MDDDQAPAGARLAPTALLYPWKQQSRRRYRLPCEGTARCRCGADVRPSSCSRPAARRRVQTHPSSCAPRPERRRAGIGKASMPVSAERRSRCLLVADEAVHLAERRDGTDGGLMEEILALEIGGGARVDKGDRLVGVELPALRRAIAHTREM